MRVVGVAEERERAVGEVEHGEVGQGCEAHEVGGAGALGRDAEGCQPGAGWGGEAGEVGWEREGWLLELDAVAVRWRGCEVSGVGEGEDAPGVEAGASAAGGVSVEIELDE